MEMEARVSGGELGFVWRREDDEVAACGWSNSRVEDCAHVAASDWIIQLVEDCHVA